MTKKWAKLFDTKWGQALVYTKENEEGKPSCFFRMSLDIEGTECECEVGISHPKEDYGTQAKFADDMLDAVNETNIEDGLKKAFGGFLND